MADEFPSVAVDPEPIFVRSSERVWTAAGVTAGIDLALSLVEDDYGTDVAQTVARLAGALPAPPRRPDPVRARRCGCRGPNAPRSATVQESIEAEPGGAHSIPELARRAAMSPRHFTRVFTDEVGEAPGAYVERIRTDAARRQLEESDDTVTVIAAPVRIRHRRDHAAQFRSTPRYFARPVPQDFRAREEHRNFSSLRGTSMQIAIVLVPRASPHSTSSGPTRCCATCPTREVRFVWHEPGPSPPTPVCCMVGATHSFDETPRPTCVLVPEAARGPSNGRPRREGARLAASGVSGDLDVDGVGVFGVGGAGRRGPAGGKRATSHWSVLSAVEADAARAPVGDERIVRDP